MNRRQFLGKFAQIGSGLLSVATVGGCSGGGGSGSKAIVTVNLDQQTRVVSVPVGSSALEAIKTAFSYERPGSMDNLSIKTTIEGETGYWQYEVNGIKPTVHAQDYPIQADCWVELALFGR